jgi:hypothetical protein
VMARRVVPRARLPMLPMRRIRLVRFSPLVCVLCADALCFVDGALVGPLLHPSGSPTASAPSTYTDCSTLTCVRAHSFLTSLSLFLLVVLPCHHCYHSYAIACITVRI